MNEKLRLKAKAATLNIPGFRTMGLNELRAAIEKRENGKQAGKPDLKVIEGGKSTAKKKTAAKKAVKSKPAPAKKAAKKKVSPPAKSGKKSATKSKSSPAKKSKSQKTAPKKATAAKGTAKRRAAGNEVRERSYEAGRVGKGGYTNLDRGGIDWTRESNVGREGKRAEVLAKLREHQGNYAAVFVDLRDQAPSWYPNAIKAYPKSPTKKAASERQLRWLIARVALDFAYKTGQHVGRASTPKKVTTTKTAKKAVKTKSASKRKTAPKAAGAARKPVRAKSGPKSAPKRKSATTARTGSKSKTARRGVR